jgi:hypothetical protein
MEARVPRYFFNVHDGRSQLDTDGTDLTGRDDARHMAVQLAGEILRDEALRQTVGDAWCLEVLDEAGKSVCRVNVDVSDPSAEG